MAAISLFWYTNMAAVTSDENDLLLRSVNNVGSKTLFNPVEQRARRFLAYFETRTGLGLGPGLGLEENPDSSKTRTRTRTKSGLVFKKTRT
jgi:hypothetical protein